MKNGLPPLTPNIAPWVRNILKDKQTLRGLIQKYGSPLNIHNTDEFEINANKYKSVFKKQNLRYGLFYARKPNKCISFVKKAKKLNIGIDTASYNELKDCLDIKYNPSKLIFTAAIKTPEAITLAIKGGVLIIIDNNDELSLVNKLAKKNKKIHPVGLRVSGFNIKGKKLYSRFGFDIDTIIAVFKSLNENKYPHLSYQGLQFHLNGYSIAKRAEAALVLIKLTEELQKIGIKTDFIDIGGGFTINYLKYKTEWQNFLGELKRAILVKRSPITFQNNGLGLINHKGEIAGKLNLYPYFNGKPQDKFLNAILEYKDNSGQTVATLLKKHNTELRIEPGRSLLDQCGITLADVIFRKHDQNNDLIVGLHMNHTQLSTSAADFCLDPLVLSSQKKRTPSSGYLVGTYCNETDLILKRKILFDSIPQIGDLVCFVNSAGYQTHFLESPSHQFNLATNLFVIKKGKQITFKIDSP